MKAALGTIKVVNQKVDCIIGVRPNERAKRQKILVTTELTLDFSKTVGHQHTDNTVDWTALKTQVNHFLKVKKYYLAETAALELAQALLHHYKLAKKCRIVIAKKYKAQGEVEKFQAEIELGR